MDLNIIEKWVNNYRLTNSYLFDSRQKDNDYHVNQDKFIYDIVNPLFFYLPGSNITSFNYTVRFDDCATNLIKSLFKYFDTPDTLIVTSNNEHENVKKLLEYRENILILSQDELHRFDLRKLEEAKYYNRVFVYIIGTQLSSGIITPNRVFKKIKEKLNSLGVESYLTIDDVQGMYIVPRDYSIFDYIIGTSHSIVGNYDLGILIQKLSSPEFGKFYYKSALTYIDNLSEILLNREAFYQFQMIMQEAFAEELANPNTCIYLKTAPNIFTIQLGSNVSDGSIHFTQSDMKLFNKYLIHLEGLDGKCENQQIRFRAQEFIYYWNEIKKGLQLLQEYIKDR